MAQRKQHRSTRHPVPSPAASAARTLGGPVSTEDLESLEPKEAAMDTHEISGTAKEAAGKAEKAYGRVKDRVVRAADELRTGSAGEYAENTTERLLEVVQENPGAAIGVSLLVGAGIGALIAYISRD